MKNIGIAMVAAICGVLSAGVAQANGITLCFTGAVNNVALLGQLNGVENGVVIRDVSGKVQFAANNYYGASDKPSTFWTQGLPTSITLPGGCSTFYFMNKTTSPNGQTPWACNAPAASAGAIDNTGVQVHVVSGNMSGGMTSGAVLIPGAPNAAPVIVQGCPVS